MSQEIRIRAFLPPHSNEYWLTFNFLRSNWFLFNLFYQKKTRQDEAGLRKLGVNLTSDPDFSTKRLFGR
jgi:hypothetical protein